MGIVDLFRLVHLKQENRSLGYDARPPRPKAAAFSTLESDFFAEAGELHPNAVDETDAREPTEMS
jgi:hypothetical protein